jgi:antitoxin component YwqK of YwqJK toxin-antitoxin module
MPGRISRLWQFRLRTLLLALTLLIVAGNGFLVWWRAPFHVDRRTNGAAWSHVDAWHLVQINGWEQEFKRALQQGDPPPARPPRPKMLYRERFRVYRNLRGEHVKHGPGEVFDDRGSRLRVEHWVHGKLHGPWIDWLPDGQKIAWGEYRQGQKHSDWVHPDGDVRTHEQYAFGVRRLQEIYVAEELFVRRRYGADGGLKESTQWYGGRKMRLRIRYFTGEDGSELADYESWHSNGERALTGRRRNGLETGEWVIRDKDGAVVRRAMFLDGRLVGKDGDPAAPILLTEASKTPGGQVLQMALDEGAAMVFAETPLPTVARYIEDAHRIPVHVDEVSLRGAGISPEAPITIHIEHGLSLRAALQILLDDLDLAAVARRDELHITTRENALDSRQ